MSNEQSLNDFISSEEVLDFTKHSIHPLFAHLQRGLEPDVKFMIQQRKRDKEKIQIPISFKNKMPRSQNGYRAFDIYARDGDEFLNSYIPGFVDRIIWHKLDNKLFYQKYLSGNRPIIVA